MSHIGEVMGKVRRGVMLIIASPSGGGKGTVIKKLLEKDENLRLSVSVTTRKIREGETDGKEYHFISEEQYRKLKSNGELYEDVKYVNNYYGTLKSEVDTFINVGKDVIFEIDWQGLRQLKEKAINDIVSINILPPSFKELRQRLIDRKTDSEEIINNRMKNNVGEVQHWDEFDYVVINEDIDETVFKIQKILSGERMKRVRQNGLAEFVQNLIDEVN